MNVVAYVVAVTCLYASSGLAFGTMLAVTLTSGAAWFTLALARTR